MYERILCKDFSKHMPAWFSMQPGSGPSPAASFFLLPWVKVSGAEYYGTPGQRKSHRWDGHPGKEATFTVTWNTWDSSETHTHIYIDICMYGCKSNYKLPENPFRPYLCSIPLIHTLWYTHTHIYIYICILYIYIYTHISIIYIIYIIYIRVYILTHIHIYICIFEHVQSDSTTCVCTYIARIHTWVHTCKNTFTMPKPVIVLASLCYTCSCYLLCCVLVGVCLAAASWQSGCFLRCSRSKLPILIKMFSHRLLLSHPLRVGYGSLKFCYAGTQSTPWGPLSFTSRRWDLGDRSEELSGQLHIVASGWRWLTVLS